ncbi:DUF2550 family protein [Nocardioides sp. W7]|uniref:DUF2550 family protein n=1 Tax=Nocardioides sp. W7 TaxID=2931390 RepID=UPI001FD27F02|nr:DUF2550 family protein [Nocardioides sp. W7]
MLIALLALLGVDLAVLLVFLAFVLARERWVKKRPGAFKGAIRLADGDLDGFAPKWRRGYGHWVRDVLVWTKAPFLLRNELIPADDLEEKRHGLPGEVKHLGDKPTLIRLRAGGAILEVAAQASDTERLLEPYR